MTTGDFALIIAALTFLATGAAALATWRYANDTRKSIDASLYPEIIFTLTGKPVGKAYEPSPNQESYIEVGIRNLHATVGALNVEFSIWLAMAPHEALVGTAILDLQGLNWKCYHKEKVGIVPAGTSATILAQLGPNAYTTDDHDTPPAGKGLETFIREFLPEVRRKELLGDRSMPWIEARLDYTYMPGFYGAAEVSRTEYNRLLIMLDPDGKLFMAKFVKGVQ